MITNFNEQILRLTSDANLAVFIENIASWIRFNASKALPENRNYHKGRYWTYSSYPELVKYFGGIWSIQSIRTMVSKCVKLGLLVTGNFNKKKYDNTNWYSLSDTALKYYPVLHDLILNTPVDSNMTPVDSNRPIPSLLTISNNNTIITSESVDSRPIAPSSKPKSPDKEFLKQVIDVYREEFPDNPQPHRTVISPSLEKILRTLIKRWPEGDPDYHSQFSLEGFRNYLRYLKLSAPKFALGEYVTEQGNKKKNDLTTFARFNTYIKALENAYS